MTCSFFEALLCEKNKSYYVFVISVGPKTISEQEHNGDQLLLKNSTVKVKRKDVFAVKVHTTAT